MIYRYKLLIEEGLCTYLHLALGDGGLGHGDVLLLELGLSI